MAWALMDMHSFERPLVVLVLNLISRVVLVVAHFVSRLLCFFQGGMCWVKLNVFYLEQSLHDLAQKFGNISSNRKDISIFIQMFQELRFNLDSLVSSYCGCIIS